MTREELLTLIEQAANEGWKELDLSEQGLTELPAEIGKLTQLETLILGKVEKWEWVGSECVPTLVANELTTLPNELAALKNLRTLNLSGNPLRTIPTVVLKLQQLTSLTLVSIHLLEISEVIGQLTNLTELHLSNNQLTQIPEVIGKLINLTRLYLHGNRLAQIPEVIGQLTNLTELHLHNNQLTQLPEGIGQLFNLRRLYLHNNQLTQLPEVIGQLSNLRMLYLHDNQLTQLPEVIGQLTNLTMLDLHNNQLTQIPEGIGQLTNLKGLSLSNNQLTQLPEVIGQLANLTVLFLFKNQLTQIPEGIGQLSNLTELYLWNNKLTQIPESIGQLTNLTVLSLSNNQLMQIPKSIGQLTNLTALSLSNNQLMQIPKVISRLTKPTELNLDNHQLVQLPEGIRQLTNIRGLSPSNHQLTQLPEMIGQLTNLVRFDLDNSQQTQLPEDFGQLTNLTKLDLKLNQISEIPNWLEDLPNLTKLDLRHNPLPISPEVLGPADSSQDPGSVEDIFNYCRQLRSGKVRPLNEAKLLLVGQGSVGKTSLISRLLDNQFNPSQSQTDGLTVRTWSVHVNSKDVRLNVWDFGGQEIYHATHQFFLTKRSLYLLACNCRTSEDENRIEYWLKLIESFGGQSPVIIIGNKCDEQPLDINRKALRDKYPNIKAIIETSCQADQGIDQLHNAITQEVGQLSDVYNLLPLSWFEVKEHLEAMDKDFISYSHYACICAAQSIVEEHNQEQLISLLHNLGLVLSFRDHPILQSTNVLNPDWVTQGIYAILSDETLKTKTKGILTTNDLTRILDAERYPANRHHYLTELMKEFQLCFQLPDRPMPTFLIPGLLPKDEPENTQLEGDTLEFQYHYRVLPESILSRFIVLTHEKIYQQIYWRSGVMLAYTEGKEPYNIARIRADLEDKKIFISISGRETTRRSFLAVIRSEFNRIHNSFANLEISEWVPVPNHPDHPLLDYQELLGLEDMGIRDYPIGKLKLTINIRQLLDGYESIEARQRQRMSDREFDRDYLEVMHPGIHANIMHENRQQTSPKNYRELKRQRLETQLNNIQSEWNTRTEKLAKLRQDLAIETSSTTKFQLEQQIQTEQEEINRLESQLSQIEQELNDEIES